MCTGRTIFASCQKTPLEHSHSPLSCKEWIWHGRWADRCSVGKRPLLAVDIIRLSASIGQSAPRIYIFGRIVLIHSLFVSDVVFCLKPVKSVNQLIFSDMFDYIII